MLTIRSEQMAVFSELEAQKFEDWTLGHLKRFFPKECALAGDREIRQRIREGTRRAARYGITGKRDICKFVDLTMTLGLNFETDLRFPWAIEILERAVDSASKISALTDYAESVLRSG